MSWREAKRIAAKSYRCGFCGSYVGSDIGWVTDTNNEYPSIHICPSCQQPTYFKDRDDQVPGTRYGDYVGHLPEEVEHLYEEARNSMKAKAHTGAALLCRKLLMNIAVTKGAKPGGNFAAYIDYLDEKSFVPADAHQYLQHIRAKGNEATHEIPQIEREDAELLITLAGILLKLIYEFPARLKEAAEAAEE